ncbi:hypothetical protein [Streptomyces griseocarneus]|uniref:hypothetical protein n=1 Tax=Streptomyces griseocarneus TaxID=51201 RepID=UPI00167D08A4|nr:hypothetical protein [Streptomyces griseocarneus]MBZ6475229.1 hypothetical protein [Streptomyces griseocarneus]
MTYGALPPLGALGAGGASALTTRSPGSGFQALATVVAATTLLMAGASVCKLLPRRRIERALSGVPLLRWEYRDHYAHPVPVRDWVAVP